MMVFAYRQLSIISASLSVLAIRTLSSGIRLISLFWLSSTTSVLACVIEPIVLFQMALAKVSKKHSIPVGIYDSLFAEYI